MANGLRHNLAALHAIRDVLWGKPSATTAKPDRQRLAEPATVPQSNPAVAPQTSASVQLELEAMLADRLAAAPHDGKGAHRARFIRHCQGVAQRYQSGLYRCYDQPLLPPTSNGVEWVHGRTKWHQRKCTGRRSTTGGDTQTLGEWLVCALLQVFTLGFPELAQRLATVSAHEYKASRREQRKLVEPARAHRSKQRRPQHHIRCLMARWNREI